MKISSIVIIVLISISSIPLFGQEKSTKISKPNILFIMVDDLRPELGSYGKEHMVTPNIDRLAKRGQLFTQAYANYPSCGPSRASLLSGLYPSRSRWMRWNDSQDEEVPGIVSLPMHFQNNNYKTVSVGKVYNSFEDGTGSWNEIWKSPRTTTEWGDYQTQKGIKVFEEVNKNRQLNTRLRNFDNIPNRGLAYERADVDDETYRDGKIATYAIEKLQDFRHSSQPFFLAVGFAKPHLPYNAPERYWELYDKVDIKLPKNMHQPKNAPDVSMRTGNHRGHYGIPSEGIVPDSLIKELIHGYYASVSYVDKQIGRVLNSVENLGLENNTIIVLWGDHGYHLGENGLWAKHVNYRLANRIPLIFKVPGKKRNIRQTGLVESVDIYPSLCDLAGLSKPFHLQGKSFAEIVDNPGIDGKEAIFYRTATGRGETILTKMHSYTEFFDNENNQIARMLYDLRVDPQENNNIAEEPRNKELMNKLSKKLHQHIKQRNRISLP